MKKSLMLGLLALGVSAASTLAQSVIKLDNYNSAGPYVNYGEAGMPANGVSGASGAVGTGLQAGWTFGFYYALGNVTGTQGTDPNSNPIGIPGTGGFAPGLTLASGSGSTAAFASSAFNNPGAAKAGSVFVIPGTSGNGAETITVMAVAYNGADYASSSYRGHSSEFTLTTSSSTSTSPTLVGSGMPAFSVFIVPEPSVFALAGLGAAGLMLIRRKK
jgi:PEP-CTERM motif